MGVDVFGDDGIIVQDDSTQALTVIDDAQHEIHEGNAFVASDVDADVDIAGPKYWRITTPNTTKWAHFTGTLSASGVGLVEFFETPTESDPAVAGTVLVAYNRNRNASTTAGLAITYDPTFEADGTKLFHARVGTTVGSNITGQHKLILKQNATYVLKFTADADDTTAWVTFDWYEHTDKL